MKATFVVRLLDPDDRLLAWSRVEAEAKPQSTRASCPFFAESAITPFVIEIDGVVDKITVHWADLDIARVSTMPERMPVKAGMVVNFSWLEPVWLTAGMQNVPLPPVTERQSVAIGVPTGTTGVKDSRIH